MAFKKNDIRINRSGRPKGAKNIVTKDLRETITRFLEKNFAKVQVDFKSLAPYQRVRLWVDLLNYSIPKLQSTELKSDLDKLTPEQLEFLADELINKMNVSKK